LVNIALNHHVVGFDIGCHEAIISNSISTTVVEVTKYIHDTVIMPHDSQCQSQPHDTV